MSDAKIVSKLITYLWPTDNAEFKMRVVASGVLLVAAKGLNVSIPLILKAAVDSMAVVSSSSAGAALTLATSPTGLLLGPMELIVAYGAARGGTCLLNEVRNVVFSKVSQGAIRRIANEVFVHLHKLDLDFHLSRQTGSISRVVDRGTRGMR